MHYQYPGWTIQRGRYKSQEAETGSQAGSSYKVVFQGTTPGTSGTHAEGTELVAKGMKLTVDADEEREFLGTDPDLPDDNEDSEISDLDPESEDESDLDGQMDQEVEQQLDQSVASAPLAAQAKAITSEQDAMELLASNPYLGNLLKSMIRQGIEDEIKTRLPENTANVIAGTSKGGSNNQSTQRVVENRYA